MNLFAGLVLCTACFAADPVGVSFNESLVGFGMEGGSENDTLADYLAAYEQGKALNKSLGFSLHVDISDIKSFNADPMHAGVCIGTATSDVLTNGTGFPVESGGKINVFDGGVLPTHELRMEYTLPFRGSDGEEYVLVGVKHMPGNDCVHILSQVTTLYVHVHKRDPYTGLADPAQIVRKGVVKISVAGTISLIASLKMEGGAGKIAQAEGFVSWGLFLVHDVLENCVNTSATQTDFHYFWASDGKTGVLLDMIKRPGGTELRLAVFGDDAAPVVYRETLAADAYVNNSGAGGGNITIGSLTMDDGGVHGTVSGQPVSVAFAGLADKKTRTNTFLPKTMLPGGLSGWVSQYAPVVVSAYGNAAAGETHTIANRTMGGGVPLTRTRYTIPFGIKALRWGMVAASQFAGTDLQVEIVSAPINLFKPWGHVVPLYVFLDGKEYKQTSELNLIQNLHRVGADGSLDANNTHRAFSIEIKLKPTLVTTANVTLSCSAPVDRFAFLEQEGHTYIHSTVMADCTAFIKKTLKKAQTFVSTGVNLLEIKE